MTTFRKSSALTATILFAAVVACAPELPWPPLHRPEAASSSFPPPSTSPAVSPTPAPAAPPFQKGIDYTSWRAGEYSSDQSDVVLGKLADLGVEWIGLVVTGYQDTASSTTIRWDLPQTPTDADLIHAIDRAHHLGMHVMLKPHVDLLDTRYWRGDIGLGFSSEEEWQAWFASYREAIDHYADLAQAQRVEQLCIGTELVKLSGRETNWREIVRDVRERYHGAITYASNHGEERWVRWWDAVDFIGVDAYYALTATPRPTVPELRQAWMNREYVAMLQGLAARYRKPILFTEVGYRSIVGAAAAPWMYTQAATPDPQVQANAYQALFETFRGRPWFAGVYWWNVTTDPHQGGPADSDYTPLGKPAEQILRRYYADR